MHHLAAFFFRTTRNQDLTRSRESSTRRKISRARLTTLALVALTAVVAQPRAINAQEVVPVSTNGGEPQGAAGATATGANSLAGGTGSNANGTNAMALGPGAFARGDSSLSLGVLSGAEVANAGVVSIGAAANSIASGMAGLYSTAIGSGLPGFVG